MILAVAAALKIQNIARQGFDLNEAALPTAEIALAAWLISGWRAGAARGAATVVFALFALTAIVKTVRGETNCGCLGIIDVDPSTMLVTDVASLSALACMCAARVPRPSGYSRLLRQTGYLSILIAVSTFTWASSEGVRLLSSRSARLPGTDEVGLLAPEQWAGQRFPLLDHISLREEIGRGRWCLLFVHRGCPRCRIALADTQRALGAGDPMRFAVIDVSPKRETGAAAAPASRWMSGRAEFPPHWRMETPWFFVLADGLVERSAAKLDVIFPAPRGSRGASLLSFVERKD